jgi:hypothetical protein
MCDFKLIEIDDGHKPGRAQRATQLAINDKPVSNFVGIFDGILPELWCERGYQLAAQRVRPWG